KAVQKHLLEQNYMTIICNTNESGMEAKKQLQMLLGQKVSGLIYINNGADDVMESTNIPTVFIDRDPRDTQINLDENYAMIECDNIQGGYLAGQELVRKGARKIAYVCYDQTLSTVKKRIQGFRSALQEAGVAFNPEYGIYADEASTGEGIRATEYIVKHLPDVDGIFYMSDVLAVGGLGYLLRNHIPVPEQIRVVGFDDISVSSNICPSLTTVHQPVEEFGCFAALRIVDMINGKDNIWQQRQRLPVKLIVRETT
ncbi:MAG TPA: substrate-binding domain-containing protein, partial [Candidatus Choladocola avistercoris]|nr:substrate-binding domain-containing protein [Candidatus Choladocola avistercoris]